MDRAFQTASQFAKLELFPRYGAEFAPRGIVVAHRLLGFPGQVMTWGKVFYLAAKLNEGLHFRSNVEVAVFVPTGIKRNDSDGVPGNEKIVVSLVVEYEGEDAAELFEKAGAMAFIERDDGFAIRQRLEGIVHEFSPKGLVIIDLAIGGKHQVAGRVRQWLGAMLDIDDGQPFVGQDGVFVGIDAAPVWPPVSQ